MRTYMFQHISWLWIFAPRLPQSSNQRRILWNRRCDQCRWKRCDNFLNATRKTNWRKKEMRSWGKKRCNVWVEVYKSFSPRLPICSSCRTRCKQDKLLHLENAEVKQGSLSSQCVPQSEADSCYICSPTQPNKQTRFSLLGTLPKITIPLKSTSPSSHSILGISWEFGGIPTSPAKVQRGCKCFDGLWMWPPFSQSIEHRWRNCALVTATWMR